MRLGEILVSRGLLSEEELERALEFQKERNHEKLGKILVDLGYVAARDVLAALSFQLQIPLAPPELISVAQSLAPVFDRLPARFLRQFCCVPLAVDSETLRLAIADPLDFETIEIVRQRTGLDVHALLASEQEIQTLLDSLFEPAAAEAEAGSGASTEDLEHLRDMASEAPVIRLVNATIASAVEKRASDIHIEPFDRSFRIRFRIDGVLYNQEAPPKELKPAIVSRVKLMAKLNIAERRLPQDGRISVKSLGRDIDVRVSTLPTLHGESVVMRLLDRAASQTYELGRLGLKSDLLARIEHLVTLPHGLFLVTGPTGSGKSTTLYAALKRINCGEKKIVTIEDPVEYQMEGINQIHVNPQIGLTFAAGLRHIVRQDPDVIMVGEIRDKETAEIAIRAALTGHLVLATLHTNDAPSAVTRLVDMGIESYLLTSSLVGVLAQRLVRAICPDCKTSCDVLSPLSNAPVTGRKGAGCEGCFGTGFSGRVGIFELLELDKELRESIMAKADATALAELARRKGMRSLWESAWEKVEQGITTEDEVLRITQLQEEAVQ